MTGRNASPPRRLRACAPCSRAKAKCHFREENMKRHICDRCETMKRVCLPQITRNLRRPRRISQSKKSISGGRVSTSDVGGNHFSDAVNTDDEDPISHHTQGQTHHQQAQRHGKLTRNPTQTESPSHTTTPQPPFGLQWLQATQILSIFRQKYTPQFPFVIIHTHHTAESLLKVNPFLFRAIMMVAAPLSHPKVAKIKRNTLANLGYRVLVEGEETLDMLQGVLVIIAWAHKCCVGNRQVANLAYLALGYAHNLGITHNTSPIPQQNGNSEPTGSEQDARSFEEQRTLLGLYCILSIVSARQSRRNPLETCCIETSLRSIAQAQAEPYNSAVDYTVRFIQMGEKLSRSFGEPHERTLLRPYAVLLEGTGSRFRNELSRLSESIPYPSLAGHSQMFQLHHLYLLVRLFEPAVIVACHPNEGVPQFVYLLTCLHNCLRAMKSFFDILLDSPIDLILRCSILTSDQATYVVLQAARLLLIEIPDWDAQSARQALNLNAILLRIISRFEEAERVRNAEVEAFVQTAHEEEPVSEMTDILKLAKETRWFKRWFEAKSRGRQVEDMLPAEFGEDEAQGVIMPSWSVGLLEEMPWNID